MAYSGEELDFSVPEALASTLNVECKDFVEGSRFFIFDSELWVFIADPCISDVSHLLEKGRHYLDRDISDDVFRGVELIHYVLLRLNKISFSNKRDLPNLGLGRKVDTVRMALRRLLDLPNTFDGTQEDLLSEALSPLNELNVLPVTMSLILQQGNRRDDAKAELIEHVKYGKSFNKKGLIFIEAEAGKGKTILLASVVKELREGDTSKLAIFIPLRKLPIDHGVNWESITQLIGIVGEGADRLARAVKSGLVAVFLDGIDEVAGRYDKNLIRGLLDMIARILGAEASTLILSGRRTEARHLDGKDWEICRVDLPDVRSTNFKDYVGTVFDGFVSQGSLPDFLDEKSIILDRQVLKEKKNIVEWIVKVFPDVAEEPSLFFIQGLAVIAIGRRSRNRGYLVQDDEIFVPKVWDVCIKAALFACNREKSKIDPIAAEAYSSKNQMKMLQGLAMLSSAPLGLDVPTPNEIAQEVFGIKVVDSVEVFVAITRQNAKHALLYATEAVGGYRPRFLNDWIRCVLLVRIFEKERSSKDREENSLGVLPCEEEWWEIAFSAQQAKYAFEFLLPSIIPEGEKFYGRHQEALNRVIDKGYASASANLWYLRAAIGDEKLPIKVRPPLPLAEITDVDFTGFDLSEELSGETFLLDGSRFINSSISDVVLKSVSLRDVRFENCLIKKMKLIDCDGPIVFEGCELTEIYCENNRSSNSPVLKFVGCTFKGEGNRLIQDIAPYGERSYSCPYIFEECLKEKENGIQIKGEWSGHNDKISGIRGQKIEDRSDAEICLRRALRTFFPSHIGDGDALQVRRYIRLTALGRGSMPPGAPGQADLQKIFESVGFTTGGRADHLYAPWSSIAGASKAGMDLRDDFIQFLRNGECKEGSSVKKMLEILERHFQ